MIHPAIKPSRDPLNLIIAMALAIIVPLGIVVQCTPAPAARAPGDSGFTAAPLPAGWDAGSGGKP
jgi:hypothetical protein